MAIDAVTEYIIIKKGQEIIQKFSGAFKFGHRIKNQEVEIWRRL
jgi:hypothetical protein|tara:strand:- start:3130 stop:3261 length:132 start_codon:yes stop_codon:yes gene_type:complete